MEDSTRGGEPAQLVNREVYEIVKARLETYEDIARQCSVDSVASLRDLTHARWICETVYTTLRGEEQFSFETLQAFIQEARSKFGLTKMTKSEWLQLVNLRPLESVRPKRETQMVNEAPTRFPEIYDAEGENLLLELIRTTFYSSEAGKDATGDAMET
ncbi:Hypothetical Protein FCC1311_101202 [Hondaea fermentalgiana]|uniref:Uncharacterized protein n=1 Tax=Hondaea fermentalgiana TaxID=2315210 RepID=A0A2R5GSP5_9STRA|nr:Hypothetical Protein FCC1311_101202 [Hondaea fermentalgiana]|eukprot:GBG33897.1 Hypothetical Protein FCC1311_101202 [Hondaea fermentalgiana]